MTRLSINYRVQPIQRMGVRERLASTRLLEQSPLRPLIIPLTTVLQGFLSLISGAAAHSGTEHLDNLVPIFFLEVGKLVRSPFWFHTTILQLSQQTVIWWSSELLGIPFAPDALVICENEYMN